MRAYLPHLKTKLKEGTSSSEKPFERHLNNYRSNTDCSVETIFFLNKVNLTLVSKL